MIPSKPLDRAISNIKYRLVKYYVRMGLTPLSKVRVCRDFSNPPSRPRDPYVINEWSPTQILQYGCWKQFPYTDRKYLHERGSKKSLFP